MPSPNRGNGIKLLGKKGREEEWKREGERKREERDWKGKGRNKRGKRDGEGKGEGANGERRREAEEEEERGEKEDGQKMNNHVWSGGAAVSFQSKRVD